MRLSKVVQMVKDLPPAYAKFERAAKALDPANSLFEERAEVVIPELLKAFRSDKTSLLDEDLLLIQRYFPQECLFESFAEIFKAEASEGRFDVFKAENFWTFITLPKATPYLAPIFNQDDGVFKTVLELVKIDYYAFRNFIDSYRKNLSSKRVDQLWEVFKGHLEDIAPGWAASERIRAKDADVFDLSQDTRLVWMSGLQSFFGCLNSSLKVLEEASALTSDLVYEFALDARLKPDPSETFKNPVGLNFHPRVLMSHHPLHFDQQLTRSQADPEVVEMLIHSWEGDLDSLLVSAKSLSGDEELSSSEVP